MNRQLASFKYAFKGLYNLIRTERNARIHIAAAIGTVLAGWWLDLSVTEWSLVTLCIGMVIAAEGFNTAIEKLTDLVSPAYHPLAEKVKDIAAGAVLAVAIAAAVVGLMVFIPKLSGLL